MRGSLRLVLMLPPQALAGMLLLNARVGAGLERGQVGGICLHEHLGHGTDVSDQSVDHVDRETLSHNDSQNLRLFFIRRKRVVCLSQGSAI